MAVNIKIDNFEGPFDLLLHLIKKNEMDIYDIRIHEITSQYMQYLNDLKEMDLEITSEFIVVAATLIEIKSVLLLPKAPKEEESDKEHDDPRKDLIDKLLEYKKFKAAAKYFSLLREKAGYSFEKKAELIEYDEDEFNTDVLKNISMLDLYNLYNKLLEIYKNKINNNVNFDDKIVIDKYKLEDKIVEIQALLITKNNVNFSTIARACEEKIEVVVTFLALLELAKLKRIKLWQKDTLNDIYIEKVALNEE